MKQSLSLADLAKELERQRDQKEDFLVPPDEIHFVSDASHSEIDIDIGGRQYLEVAEIAHGQIADRLSIPKRFYDRLRHELPTLLDETVGRLLRHVDRDNKWMIRTLDGNVRAALSSQYRRIDNSDVAEVVLPVLQTIPEVHVRSAYIDGSHMYIKATTPRLTSQVRVGQDVCAGVVVRNSEVGTSKLVVAPFIETLQCQNGMIVTKRGSGMEQIHLGRHLESDSRGHIVTEELSAAQDRALAMTMREAVRTAVDEVCFEELVEDMRAAASDETARDGPAAVETLAEQEALTEDEGRGILEYLADGGDLSRWGMISAVTRTAEDADSYDRATELEALGGKILNYSDRKWRDVAYAQNS